MGLENSTHKHLKESTTTRISKFTKMKVFAVLVLALFCGVANCEGEVPVADAAPVAAEIAKPVEDVPAPVEDVPAPVEDVPAGFVAHYWGSCPVSHPYAYNTGSHCCKSNKEKVYAPQGKSCDGSAIAFDSTCCKGDQWVTCPKGPGKCMNNIGGSCPVSHPYAYNLVHTVANQTKKRCTHHKGSYAMEVQLLSTVHVAKETNGSLVLKVLGNARTT